MSLVFGLLLLLGIGSGCESNIDPAQRLEGVRLLDRESIAAKTTRVSPPLTLKEWVDEGMPTPTREWQVADWSKAYKTFARIADVKAEQLPRASGETKVLFDRLSGAHFLEEVLKSSDKPADKLAGISVVITQSSNLLGAYSWHHFRTGVYSDEMVALTDLLLRAAGTQHLQMRLAQSDPWTSDRSMRANPPESMNRSSTNVLVVCISELARRKSITLPARRKLAGILAARGTPLLNGLDEKQRQRVAQMIDLVVAEETDSAIKTSLLALRAKASTPASAG